jgi:hypothetical protein
MSFIELMPALDSLPRADKVRVIQYLAAKLGGEDESVPFTAGRSYPIWSPYDAHEAAAVLSRLLEEEKGRS